MYPRNSENDYIIFHLFPTASFRILQSNPSCGPRITVNARNIPLIPALIPFILDPQYASCSKEMQAWCDADWTYNAYTEGSLVWAKIDGFPWWPAMVECDPDIETFAFCYRHRRYTPVRAIQPR